MDMEVWKVRDGEVHWVIASSRDDAMAVMRESAMWEEMDSGDGAVLEALSPESVLTVNEDEERISRSCGEWVAAEGRGYLAGTCF